MVTIRKNLPWIAKRAAFVALSLAVVVAMAATSVEAGSRDRHGYGKQVTKQRVVSGESRHTKRSVKPAVHRRVVTKQPARQVQRSVKAVVHRRVAADRSERQGYRADKPAIRHRVVSVRRTEQVRYIDKPAIHRRVESDRRTTRLQRRDRPEIGRREVQGDRVRQVDRSFERRVVTKRRDHHVHRPSKPVIHHRVVHRHRVHHYYPAFGHRVSVLPRWRFSFVLGGLSYAYLDGVFYRPYGAGYVVVAAPIGAAVRVLPPYYSVVYVGSTPYYYANGAYYVRDPVRAGYLVVPPPEGLDEGAPATFSPMELFVYPNAGQSEAQQSIDRQECDQWAVYETGIDPSFKESKNGDIADYIRAVTACLEARDYTVK